MMCSDLGSERGQFDVPKAIAHATKGFFAVSEAFF